MYYYNKTDKGIKYIQVSDDIFITMTYARNLIHHGELVWQTGDRVNGLTNTGWAMMLAPFFALGISDNYMAIFPVIMALLANLFIFALLYSRIKKLFGHIPAFLSSLCFVLSVPLVFGVSAGLESSFAALLILAGWLETIPKHPQNNTDPWFLRMILLSALAVVIRPDSGLFFIIFCVYSLHFTAKNLKHPSYAVYPVLAGSLIVLLFGLFNLFYYGNIFPNTFYLKGTHGANTIKNGFSFLWGLIVQDGLIWLLPCSVFGALTLFFKKRYKDSTVFGVIVILLWLLYLIWTGGDAMEHGRFLIPILPVIIFFFSAGIHRLLEISVKLSLSKDLPFRKALALFFVCLFFTMA